MRLLPSAIAVAAVSFLASITTAAVVPDQVARTDTAVRSNTTTILHWAYPTADKVTDALEGNWFESTCGFDLDEKFSYTDSDGAAQSFTLRFTLNQDGSVRSITTLEQSELWPAFGTGNLILAVLQSDARDQVDAAQRANQPPPTFALIILRAGSITDALVLKLNADR